MTKKAIARLIEAMTEETALRLHQTETGQKILPEAVEVDSDTMDIARTLVGRAVKNLRRQIVDSAAPLEDGFEDPVNGPTAQAAKAEAEAAVEETVS